MPTHLGGVEVARGCGSSVPQAHHIAAVAATQLLLINKQPVLYPSLIRADLCDRHKHLKVDYAIGTIIFLGTSIPPPVFIKYDLFRNSITLHYRWVQVPWDFQVSPGHILLEVGKYCNVLARVH